jgi:hypothetical protein
MPHFYGETDRSELLHEWLAPEYVAIDFPPDDASGGLICLLEKWSRSGDLEFEID